MENVRVEHLKDWQVDAALDAQLRALLSGCFTKPQDAIFKTQRFFSEPPAMRWIIRSSENALAAHAACHLKTLKCDGKIWWCGGIAEVAVHPDFRGLGYVKLLLESAHDWLRHQGIPFAILLGNPLVYNSSGYHMVTNLMADGGAPKHEPKSMILMTMVQPLTTISWPKNPVVLLGESHF